MYSNRHHLTIGFHGCDKEVALKVLNNPEKFKHSANPYDWLGHGFYFWENNYQRALDFANHAKDNPTMTKGEIKTPFVLGAVLDLGKCLDLLEANSIKLLKTGYKVLKEHYTSKELPKNKESFTGDKDKLLRLLDCSVIETLHTINSRAEHPQFDSVRAAFLQGKFVYPNTFFQERNNIQICIRNTNCIKGFFLPRELNKDGFSHFPAIKRQI